MFINTKSTRLLCGVGSPPLHSTMLHESVPVVHATLLSVAILLDVICHLTVIVICIYPVMNEVEHFFHHFLTSPVFSYGKCILVSFACFYWIVCVFISEM